MNRTFNNGIGMVVVIDAAAAPPAARQTLRAAGETGVRDRRHRRRAATARQLN